MKKLAVELFSGTAGATAAFRNRTDWHVITVDIDGRHRPTIVADARALPMALGPDVQRPVELLWCSPPCTEFSDANPRAPLRPSLDLFVASLEAVRCFRPRYWVIENVRGAIPFFGVPAQKIGPWCLWGYFPELRVSLSMHDHRKFVHRTAVDRAAVPREVSDALYDAIVRSAALSSLLDLRPFRRHRHIRGRTASAEQFDLYGRTAES